MIMKIKLEIYEEMMQAAEDFYIEFQKTQYAAQKYYIENRLWSPREYKKTAEKIYKDLKLLVPDNAVDIVTRYFKEIMDIEVN